MSISIKHKNSSRQCEFELPNMHCCRFCSEETSESLTSGMSSTKVRIEFNCLSVQVMESQLCL